uniref:Neur_chan_LBD domain-containing protein n=1 Tax=Caenorhabditis tropicalis TaxID=1561998 RepID=A0A1I7T3L2_9PELO
MIIVYYLSILLPLLVSSSFDEDLIIERRPHHVDWEDLFMEYNRYSAPNRVKQEINVTIEVISIRNDKILFEMNQDWRDERLRFVGVARVPVPSHILPWYPDTYIRNGWDVVIERQSTELNYDGTFQLKQKYQAAVDMDESTKDLSLVISSYNNYGTDRVHYNLVSTVINVPSHSHLVSKQVARKSDGIHFDDIHITIQSNPINNIISGNSTF